MFERLLSFIGLIPDKNTIYYMNEFPPLEGNKVYINESKTPEKTALRNLNRLLSIHEYMNNKKVPDNKLEEYIQSLNKAKLTLLTVGIKVPDTISEIIEYRDNLKQAIEKEELEKING